MLSQESQNQGLSEQQKAQTARQEQGVQQPEPEPEPTESTEQQAGAETPAKPPRKRRVRKLTEAELNAISPRPSYWPIVLAFAIVVFLYGAIGNDYIMYGGIVLIVAAIIGWSLERR